MDRDQDRQPAADASVDSVTREVLTALLTLDAETVRAIRAAAARPRPRPQTGPVTDHGD